MIPASSIADYVRRAFGDEASIQIQDSDLVNWINAAVREITAHTELKKAIGTTALIEGQDTYDLSSLKALKIHSIYAFGIPLEYRSFQEAEEYLLASDPARLTKGQPQIWYPWGETITLWPTPDRGSEGGFGSPGGGLGSPGGDGDSGRGGGSGDSGRSGQDRLRVYYTARIDPIDDLTGRIDLPPEYHNRIIEYVMSQAYELDEDNENSGFKQVQFAEGMQQLSLTERVKNTQAYPMITIMEEDM